jgi:hypothetical protein
VDYPIDRVQDNGANAYGAESLEADDSLCFRDGLDFRELRSARSLTGFLSLGVADVSEGRVAFWDRKLETYAPPQLPLMAGHRRNASCQQKLMRHADIRTTFNIYYPVTIFAGFRLLRSWNSQTQVRSFSTQTLPSCRPQPAFP